MSGSMYWHGRPLEDVHAEVNRVLKLAETGSNRPASRPAKAPEVRTCADDSTAQMRRLPMPGTVSGTAIRSIEFRCAWGERTCCAANLDPRTGNLTPPTLCAGAERRRADRPVSLTSSAAPGLLAPPSPPERADSSFVQQLHCTEGASAARHGTTVYRRARRPDGLESPGAGDDGYHLGRKEGLLTARRTAR